MLRFDTKEKRLSFVIKGNIVTFKKAQGYNINFKPLKQILVKFIHQPNNSACQLIGENFDSEWYNSIDELLDAINWEWMEENVIIF